MLKKPICSIFGLAFLASAVFMFAMTGNVYADNPVGEISYEIALMDATDVDVNVNVQSMPTVDVTNKAHEPNTVTLFKRNQPQDVQKGIDVAVFKASPPIDCPANKSSPSPTNYQDNWGSTADNNGPNIHASPHLPYVLNTLDTAPNLDIGLPDLVAENGQDIHASPPQTDMNNIRESGPSMNQPGLEDVDIGNLALTNKSSPNEEGTMNVANWSPPGVSYLIAQKLDVGHRSTA